MLINSAVQSGFFHHNKGIENELSAEDASMTTPGWLYTSVALEHHVVSWLAQLEFGNASGFYNASCLCLLSEWSNLDSYQETMTSGTSLDLVGISNVRGFFSSQPTASFMYGKMHEISLFILFGLC